MLELIVVGGLVFALLCDSVRQFLEAMICALEYTRRDLNSLQYVAAARSLRRLGWMTENCPRSGRTLERKPDTAL
jgi:hypothetical protein